MSNATNVRVFPLQNGKIMSEGSRAVTGTFDFTSVNQYTADLTQQQELGFVGAVQSLYIDNSQNASALTVYIQTTGQRIVAPPHTIGYYPCYVNNPPVFLVTSTAGDPFPPATSPIVTILFLNFPQAPWIWDVEGSAQLSGDSLSVVDANLATAIANGLVNTLRYGVGANAAASPVVQINETIVNSAITASGSTALLAANASFGWYIGAFRIELSPDATLAAPGVLTVQLRDGTTTIFQTQFYVGAALAATAASFGVSSPAGFLYNAKALNTALNINLSAALTAGTIRFSGNVMQSTNIV